MDRTTSKTRKAALVTVEVNHSTQVLGAKASTLETLGFSSSDQRIRSGAAGRAPAGPASDTRNLNAEESARLLHIIDAASKITRHYELFLLLQGEVQHFIPHQIMLSAWGDFRDSSLQLDVISGLRGVRTGQLNGCSIDGMLKNLFARWVANGRRPMLLDNADGEQVAYPISDCALFRAMRPMRSLLVHGTYNERDEIHSLYLALNPGSMVNGQGAGLFLFRANALIAQLDVAFRKVAVLKSADTDAGANASPEYGNLSTREREIIKWVSDGKTNDEIAGILGISSFTVKNHVSRIFRKLGVTNRTEAVARYQRKGLRARIRIAGDGHVLFAE